jgi:2Fe-2S ferredoxin
MKLNVIDRRGKTHRLDAIDGWRVMEIIRDAGMSDAALDLKAECGGAMACATCHVYVDKDWEKKIFPASPDEKDILADFAFEQRENSRLSCQILMSEALDGLTVTLAPGTES